MSLHCYTQLCSLPFNGIMCCCYIVDYSSMKLSLAHQTNNTFIKDKAWFLIIGCMGAVNGLSEMYYYTCHQQTIPNRISVASDHACMVKLAIDSYLYAIYRVSLSTHCNHYKSTIQKLTKFVQYKNSLQLYNTRNLHYFPK